MTKHVIVGAGPIGSGTARRLEASTMRPPHRPGATRLLVRRAYMANKPLALVGLAMALILLVATVGLVADPRVITGAPAWLKPAKFAISVATYSFTLLWLLTFVSGHRRVVRIVSWVTAAALALEMAIIAGAAALGTTSHFNVSTAAHAASWSTMAVAIVLTWLANLVVGVLLLRQPLPDAAFAWSLRLGVLISAVGMGVAFLMTSPTAQQLTAATSSGTLPVAGAHSVGVADGGPGLPVVGWSTVGGDLRIGHFLGLHGLQALPLLGLLLTRRAPSWLSAPDRTALVLTAGATYLGIVALVTWQALRGQPLIKPDAVTLTIFGVILAAAATLSSAIVVRARIATLVDLNRRMRSSRR